MNLGKLLQKFKDPVFRAKFDSRYGFGRVETFLAGHWFNPLAEFSVISHSTGRKIPFLGLRTAPLLLSFRDNAYGG